MSYQDFQEHYPYCVYYYFDTKTIVVKNRNYSVIAEYISIDGFDYKSEFDSFSCDFEDCIRESDSYIQGYLYDEGKEPIFDNEKCLEKHLENYMKRKNKLDIFLLKFKSNGLSFMH